MINENGLTMRDLEAHFVGVIMNNGWAANKKDAKNLLIEAIARNLVANEIYDMCQYIATEQKEVNTE
jgi:hypothetical protein